MKEFLNIFKEGSWKVNGVEWHRLSLKTKATTISYILGTVLIFALALVGIFKLVTSDVLFLRACGGIGVVLFIWTVKATIKIEYKKK